MSLAQRSFRSVTWTTITTLVGLPVNLLQSIILARTLPIEYFGIIAGIGSIINVTSTFFEFGFTSAFLHRAEETANEDQACAAFFTLKLIFETIWAFFLIVFGLFAFTDLRRYVLIVLVIASFLLKITLAPRVLLVRRVEHRRLAIIDLVIGLTTAVLSISIALTLRSIWALLIASVVTLVISFTGLYLWKPFWKPRLIWDPKVFRYYISFGVRNLVNNLFDSGLDNLDNLWTGYYLGDLLLGFYSRAFKFAIYPRLILSSPVNSVLVGTYAELKYDRRRLSMAFFRTNAFLIRAGFLLAGWLAVIAPYFIRLIIGERWMPMLTAFRLMLVFALLDPLKVSISNVLLAVGKPEKITIIRITQAVILIVGLFILGTYFQIAGVALSMDLMIIVGTALSLYFAHAYVDVSYRRLFTAPLVSLGVGLGLTLLSNLAPTITSSDWAGGVVKTILFLLGYLGVLFVIERKELLSMIEESFGLSSIGQKIRSALEK